MEAEPVEIVCQMVKEMGYKVRAEASLDGTIGHIWIQKILDFKYEKESFAPFFTVMEVDVNGPMLVCKSDHVPITICGTKIDLHCPDSIDEFKKLLEDYEQASRKRMDETLMQMFLTQFVRKGK